MRYGDPDFLDDNGLVVNRDDKDGGDSCFNTCHLALMSSDRDFAKYVLMTLEVRDGLYCRNPNGTWTNDVDRLSRDQAIPLVILMSLVDRARLKRFMWKHLKRFGFMYNTRRNGTTKENHGQPYGKNKVRDYSWKVPDWCGFEFFSLYVRGLRLWPLYPILLLCDLETLLTSLWLTYWAKDENDITNHIIFTVINVEMPTPFSWLAAKVLNTKDMKTRMRNYWYYGQRAYFIGDLYIGEDK